MRTPWLAAATVAVLALVPGQKAQAQNPTAYYQPHLYNNPNQAWQLELERQKLEDLQILQEDLLAREKALDKDARDRARAYLLEARKTVEAALGQARAAVTEATAKEARRMVEEAIEKSGGTMERGNVGKNDLKIGDKVRTGQGKVGVVTEVRDHGRVVVEVGAVRLVIASDLLELVQPSNIPTVPPSTAS